MKKCLAILCALCLLFALAACSINITIPEEYLEAVIGDAAQEQAGASEEAGGSSGEASMGMPGGGSSSVPDSYDAVMEITSDETVEGVEMESVNGDENILSGLLNYQETDILNVLFQIKWLAVS